MKPDYGPLELFALIASLAVGQKMNPVVAPYLLILVMSTAGALVALGRQDKTRRPSGLTFVFIVNCIAMGCTTVLSSVIASRFDFLEAPHLFAPVAFGIGLIGLDWPSVIPKVIKFYREWRRGGTNV